MTVLSTRIGFYKILRMVLRFPERNYSTTITDSLMHLSDKPVHIPVMKNEVTEYLNLKDGDTVLDMTFGGGGHSKHLLERYPNLKIIALDRDPIAYEFAKNLKDKLPRQIVPLLGKFSELHELAQKNNIPFESVDGIIFDLGASSMQMDTAERGFSLSKMGPLDMRMDCGRYYNSITAADVINHASESDLFKIFKIYGQVRRSRLLAMSIIQTRITYQNFKTTKDLVDLVELVCNRNYLDKLGRKAHSATKVFQALRIFVNDEINELNQGIKLAYLYLKRGGRITVLSFHSVEDVVVKNHFLGQAMDVPQRVSSKFISSVMTVDSDTKRFEKKLWKVINKNVIVPRVEEVNSNPRSRSAKMRVAEKL